MMAKEIRHLVIRDDCKTRGIPGTDKLDWPLCDSCAREVAKIQPVIEYVSKFVRRAIAESQAWISVEQEELPAKFIPVLIYYRDSREMAVAWSNGDPAQWHPSITHWMPLPEPPKGNENV